MWWQEPLRLAGLALGGAIALTGFTAIWWARRGADEDMRVRLPMLGPVGTATCLTIGVCLVGAGYLAAAYALPTGLAPPRPPARLWWIPALLFVLAGVGAAVSEKLEAPGGDPGDGDGRCVGGDCHTGVTGAVGKRAGEEQRR